ncbi:MAG TPA: hypothetical protein VFJ18_09410 [Pararhizobium sp.]|nr:hypothetical protein [Pararhizobium sp.]
MRLNKVLARGMVGAFLACTCLAATAPRAAAGDAAFFNSVIGTWSGPGRVVAGKYKGTRFVCDLTGSPLAKGKTGIAMGGHCRVGIFTQDMSAVISRGPEGYTGRFLDGADNGGLDVTSGEVKANKVVVGINRKQLYGAMVASLHDKNTMNVTISVKVGERLVPVIGLTLARDQAPAQVGAIE